MTKESLLNKLNNAKLRKVKSRMIKEALTTGASERGNHKVEYTSDQLGGLVEFWYRNTSICVLFLDDLRVAPVNAGIYDNTPSTINQRKAVRDAVEEIRKAVGE